MVAVADAAGGIAYTRSEWWQATAMPIPVVVELHGARHVGR
jgi:hypothetical protein